MSLPQSSGFLPALRSNNPTDEAVRLAGLTLAGDVNGNTFLTFDLNGPDVLVSVTRNLAADDSVLHLVYSTNLVTWIDAGPPGSELPGGDRTAIRTYVIQGCPGRLFVRLAAALAGP